MQNQEIVKIIENLKGRRNYEEKKASKLVFGCDNQIDINHAFSMFDYFYSIGGNVFDTAFIYNNGKSDEYLGRWINSRGLENDVIVLGKEPIHRIVILKLSVINFLKAYRD